MSKNTANPDTGSVHIDLTELNDHETLDNNNNNAQHPIGKSKIKNKLNSLGITGTEIDMLKYIRKLNLSKSFDAHMLTTIFDGYATKKTIATGFFNIALVTTNFAQMKDVITRAKKAVPANTWNGWLIAILSLVCISLTLQFVLAFILVFLAKSNELIDEHKRNQLIRSNNFTTLLVLVITIINIFVNVFISI
jgi:hypothetical protein